MFDDKNIQIFSDRDKIREQLILYMREYLDLEDQDLAKTSYLSYLINVLSVLTSNLIYYNTSVYREFFLTKAIQKESVLNLGAMMGYTPPFASAANVQILVTIPTSFDSETDITIPKRFKYYSGKIPFEQTNEVQINLVNPGTSTVTAVVREILSEGGSRNIPFDFNEDKSEFYFSVDALQTETQTIEFSIPQLQPYEFHTIDLNFSGSITEVDIASIDVVQTLDTVTSITETWEMNSSNSLFLIPPDTAEFAFRATITGGKLFFGNGIMGKQPPAGAICSVTVKTTSGIDGNVISGSIRKTDNLYVEVSDGVGGTIIKPVKTSVINTSPAFNGSDAPTIDEIRQGAIANVSSGKRLTSELDYSNIQNIVEDLPIQHATSILKRSDIKSNEISVFTDILFESSIVPTVNASWSFDTTGLHTIVAGEIVNIDSVEYETLFDIDIDPENKVSRYYYVINNVDVPVLLTKTYSDATELLPTVVTFETTRTGDPLSDYLTLTLSFQQLNTGDYSHVTAICIDGWENNIYDMARPVDPITLLPDFTQNKFVCTILLTDIPSGEEQFYFRLSGDTDPNNSTGHYCDSEAEIIVKRDLSEYMYSQLHVLTTENDDVLNQVITQTIKPLTRGAMIDGMDLIDRTYPIHEIDNVSQDAITYTDGVDYELHEEYIDWLDGTASIEPASSSEYIITYKYRSYEPFWDGLYNCTIYDVPVVRKDYLNGIDQNAFALQVLQKIVSFNVADYRMLTDFVNLKFSNTTGQLTNMLFNSLRQTVWEIDPTSIPTLPGHGEAWVVLSPDNVWSGDPWYKTEGQFIAEWDNYLSIWTFQQMSVNDMIHNLHDGNTYLFNGDNLVSPILDIPFNISLIAWHDTTTSITSQALSTKIKNKLVDEFYTKFGYDFPIYRSEIIKVIQSIEGVGHCELREPEHDIFFDYDIYQDFTQQQLLTYTPQLVYFDTTAISVEIR